MKISSLTKAKYVVATNSGTSALHISCILMNIQKNDEVIVPSFTFVGTVNAVKYCGGIPHFVDIEESHFGINVKKLTNYLKKIVIKKTGVRQEYDRTKLENSIRISCTKRPISEQTIQEAMMRIEQMVNNHNNIEISSRQIGKFVMDELKSIDKVAFIRFASVYREFEDLGEFKTQIDDLSN